MLRKIRRFFYNVRTNLLKKNLTKNFRMIFLGRITLNSATQLMGLFLPIFLYQFFNLSLQSVMIYYLLIDFLFMNLIVFSCRGVMNKVGIKRSLQISIFLGAVYYLLFIFIEEFFTGGGVLQNINPWLVVAPTILFGVLFRVMHWVPFHTNIAKLTEKHIRVGQISLMEATILFLGAIMPILAGVVLEILGYRTLFIMAIVIYFISLIPFSLLPDVKEKFVWTWRQTWKKFFSKKMRSNVLAYMGDGAESIVGSVIWPIFIWDLLSGNYFEIGAISSLIIIVTILLQLFFGNLLNKASNRRKFLRFGVFLYSLGWILKALIESAFQIFLFSTYHNVSRIFSHTSFDTLNYDIAADQGQYVDEYTAIKEMAVLMGKVIMIILVLVIISLNFSLRYVFILAALGSLSMTSLRGDKIKV